MDDPLGMLRDQPPDLPGLREAARQWELGAWHSLSPMAHGVNNESFLLAADRGRFVLRRARASKTLDDIRFEHALIAHLLRHGLPVPEPVPGRDGGTWILAGGRLWSLAAYIASGPLPDSENAARQAGEVLGRFHAAAAQFVAAVPVPGARSKATEARDALDALPRLDHPAAQALAQRIRAAVAQSAAAEAAWSERLRIGIIHGGCRMTSVLFREGRLVALLDLDSARQGPRAQDIAISLASFAKPKAPGLALHPARAAAFREGYSARAAIEEPDRQAIAAFLPGVLLRQALADLARFATAPADGARFAKAEARSAAAELALARPETVSALMR